MKPTTQLQCVCVCVCACVRKHIYIYTCVCVGVPHGQIGKGDAAVSHSSQQLRGLTHNLQISHDILWARLRALEEKGVWDGKV